MRTCPHAHTRTSRPLVSVLTESNISVTCVAHISPSRSAALSHHCAASPTALLVVPQPSPISPLQSLFRTLATTHARRHLPRFASTVKVFGHKVPDTDTVCSAMVREWDLAQQGIPAQAYRLGELNKETAFVLQSLGLEQPPLLEEGLTEECVVSIVDTNNPAELPENVESAQIHSIIDHHKMAGLTTAEPLEIDMRPLCSASSILYARMKTAGVTPTKEMAGLMLSCIISDSLEFRSPTTTDIDRVYVEEG